MKTELSIFLALLTSLFIISCSDTTNNPILKDKYRLYFETIMNDQVVETDTVVRGKSLTINLESTEDFDGNSVVFYIWNSEGELYYRDSIVTKKGIFHVTAPKARFVETGDNRCMAKIFKNNIDSVERILYVIEE